MLKTIGAVWYKSWTKLLAYVQMASAGTVFTLGQMHPYVSDPTFKSYLDQMDVPKTVIIGLATIGLITWLAHGREND